MRKRTTKASATLAINDINVSSLLVASDIVKLISSKRDKNNIVYFHFSPKERAQELVDEYWQGEGPLLPAKRLFGARRDLQDLIFSRSADND